MSTPTPLRINFSRSANSARTGISFMVAGAFLFSVSVAWHFSVHRDVVAVKEQVKETEKLLRRSPTRVEASRKNDRDSQQQVQIANSVVQQISIPWDHLFSDIENSAGDDVALLSVQPDATARTVRINGEAKKFPALVAYIRRLEDTEHLSRVTLQVHEVKAQDPQKPVVFLLHADWGARK